MTGIALFDTPLGPCGLAWSARGICGVQLPEADADSTRSRLQRRYPGARESVPSPLARLAIDAMVALLAGRPARFDDIALDLRDTPPFNLRVYEIARAIPAGETASYGEIATRLGEPGAARAVGQALGQNPIPIIIPCHRVLAAGHRPGGFSAHGQVATKRRLLEIEGALSVEKLPLFREANHVE
ncbi:MAG: methylated-DNA--[protein]-cysteine S-methyltransferase [Steroidobacteraceae bacterium]